MGLLVLACAVAISAPRAHAENRSAGVFVTLSQVTDDVERQGHIDAMKTKLGECPLLANRIVDVNVTRLSYAIVGSTVEVQLELGLVMSNGKQEIVSIANQSAKLVLSKHKFKLEKLPALRREVLDTAVGELIVKLRRAQRRNAV